ncbi:MAG: VTT domain-containing protein [Candidatus Nanoarchaeia archaeon]|nr:VTT domain-containing protein [Candidatus Nanoarchaeia archaeon]MDD5587538.1 VTT domain-containing protein [Candidatus Nanoarchaeia archaeon]
MIISQIINFVLHMDDSLIVWTFKYGTFIYGLLFLIILGTGFVFTPFLPGDSLIFAAGTLAAQGVLNPFYLVIVLTLAAVLGDIINYYLGKHVGNLLIRKKYVKQEHIDKTHHFYEKYGGKTIIIARFVPIVRTFAPFVAGIAKMKYSRFSFYNITGAAMWATGFVSLGYFFGNLPFVRENYSVVIVGIIFVSLLPVIIEGLRHHIKKRNKPENIAELSKLVNKN